MDEKLYKALDNQTKPFMKDAIVCDDLLRIDDLNVCLNVIIKVLKFNYGKQNLFFLDDWHNHDGFVNCSKKIQWSKFETITNSARSLYKNRCTDDFVFSSFYPESLGFLLRIDVLDEDDDELYPGIWREFNLFANDDIINEIVQQLSNELNNKLKIENSVQYMTNAYAG
jgi:hypothetical protein